MKRIFYILGVISILFSSCSEDELIPSNLDKDWYKLTDSGTTPVDQKIYNIYQETAYPIFTNDTIGKELRGQNPDGEDIWYYETLNYNYFIQTVDYEASIEAMSDEERSTILDYLNFFDDEILSFLPEGVTRSFYFVKDLNYKMTNSSSLFPVNVYIGLSTTVVGNVLEYSSMTDEEKLDYKYDVLAIILANYIMLNDTNGYLDDFISYSSETLEAPYDILVGSSGIDYDDYEDLGFLAPKTGRSASSTSYYAPSKSQDITDYFKMYISNNKEIYSEFSNESAIKFKFALFTEALENFGLKITE